MTLQELKNCIESHTIPSQLIIFKNSENDIISNQYIKAIAKSRQLEISYLDSPETLLQDSLSLFAEISDEIDTNLNVIKTEVFTWENPGIRHLENLIIVISKFASKELEKTFEPYIITIPKLEEWQVKDYVYSMAEGVPTKQLDWLIQICGKNKYRLLQEVEKLSLFNSMERRYVFDALIDDGEFNDLSSYGIFNFTTALTSKDLTTLASIYKEIDNVDINEFGLLTILLKNFKNLLMVQLNSNPTPENTGLESKQLWAIKRLPRVYSPNELANVFTFLSDIDRQVKNGELPTSIMRDYMILKILSMGGC